MLFAQTHAPFFPPAYFWVFVFAIVLVGVTGLVTMIVACTRAQCARAVRERELAAHLVEIMLTQQRLSPQEIDQVLNSYRCLGSLWRRFQHLWPTSNQPRVAIPPQKTLAA